MRFLTSALLVAALALLVMIMAGHLNSLHPALDSLSHFRLQLDVLGMAAALMLAARGMRLGAAAIGVVSALSLAITTLHASFPGHTQAEAGAGPVYRLLQANLRFDNRTPESFLQLLAETKPDIVTVEEISAMWVERLKSIKSSYPFQQVCPGRDALGGVAILSRRPFANSGPSLCAADGALAVDTVDFAGRTVLIAAVHLEWPWPHKQPQQLGWLADEFGVIAGSALPVLIGGDMNATPWSAAVGRIGVETGTKPLAQGWGTWLHIALPPALAPWIGLPIDNILANPGITLLSSQTQRYIGSDHRPILVEFTIPGPRPTTIKAMF